MPAEPRHGSPAQPQCLLSNLEVKINYIRGLVVVVQVAAAAISAIYCWSAHNNQARLAQAAAPKHVQFQTNITNIIQSAANSNQCYDAGLISAPISVIA